MLAISAFARAESGQLNLHANLGLTIISPLSYGVMGVGGVDWQFRPPFALDLTVGGGYTSGSAAANLVHAAAGIRVRLLDNREGYAEEHGGDQWGNLFLVPRVGYLLDTGTNASFVTADVELGYEFSMARPPSNSTPPPSIRRQRRRSRAPRSRCATTPPRGWRSTATPTTSAAMPTT